MVGKLDDPNRLQALTFLVIEDNKQKKKDTDLFAGYYCSSGSNIGTVRPAAGINKHRRDITKTGHMIGTGPPLWSSGREFLARDPEVRVRFAALPHFLRSSGSGTGSTQPREYNWEATRKKK
jgi:hypothetical protein